LKISFNWLKDYINLSDLTAQEIAAKLTSAGLEVEEIIDYSKIYKNFVVGKVLNVEKHPKADKLSVCQIKAGYKEYRVVCGAPNVRNGMKVALALQGAIIPANGMEIKNATIRGVESFGMLCSEKELNISDDHSGIMQLNDELTDGEDLASALGLNDVVFEIGITPNRPDALSHFGVARELSAILDRDLCFPDVSLIESDSKLFENYAKIVLEDDDCLRYCSRVIINVEVKESPEWLKKRLKAVGLRPINNIVDATNYVLYELGHPLHAFDLDKIEQNSIIVRKSKKNEKFVALDGKERILDETMLMICDAKKSLAIAGVMGGENSGISESTKNILLESAYFNPSSIRRTSKKLQLSTDSSYRFERGVDYNGAPLALERVASIIQKIAGGEVLKGREDVKRKIIDAKKVNFRFNKATKILGYEIEKEKIKRYFSRLGINLLEENEASAFFEIPTYRGDIEREIDLIEEAARLNGYDNIPTVERININLKSKTDDSEKKEKIRDICVSLGLIEMMNNSLISEKSAKLFGNPIKILNPQSSDMDCLRTSLLTGALETVKRNINVGEKNLKLFEIGNVFKKLKEGNIQSFDDFKEYEELIIVLSGYAESLNWHTKDRKFDIYDLKGYIEGLLEAVNLKDKVAIKYKKDNFYNYEYGFEYLIDEFIVIRGGKLNKEILKFYDIQQEVFSCEINLKELTEKSFQKRKFSELLKYPKVVKDFAFIFDKKIDYYSIKNLILSGERRNLKEVKIFDVFEDKNLGDDKRSLAFSLTFYNVHKTLTEEEVNEEFWSIIKEIENKFNAKLRG